MLKNGNGNGNGNGSKKSLEKTPEDANSFFIGLLEVNRHELDLEKNSRDSIKKELIRLYSKFMAEFGDLVIKYQTLPFVDFLKIKNLTLFRVWVGDIE